MKSRFALLALLLVAAAPLAAQGGGGGRGRGGITGNADAAATALSLTADQKTKYQAVIDEYAKTLQPLQAYAMAQRGAGAQMSEDSMKKQTDTMAKRNAALRAILNSDQQKLFDSLSTAGRGGGRRGGGGGQ